MTIKIETMKAIDWEQVRDIYIEGIETGNATFQQEAPTWEEWDMSHLFECRFVARSEGDVLGWCALTPVSSRCVYRGVAEVSVYVGVKSQGRGVGSLLMDELVRASEENGIWTLQSGIFPENTGSIYLHKKFGFREVGVRERIGKMNGVWRDNLFFERRSTIVGID